MVLEIISISLVFIMKIQVNGALSEIMGRQADSHGHPQMVTESFMLRLRTVQAKKC